jgi:hypothetical protein
MAALPAAAIVIATIAAKQVFDSGLEIACGKWKESLDKQAGKEQGSKPSPEQGPKPSPQQGSKPSPQQGAKGR